MEIILSIVVLFFIVVWIKQFIDYQRELWFGPRPKIAQPVKSTSPPKWVEIFLERQAFDRQVRHMEHCKKVQELAAFKNK